MQAFAWRQSGSNWSRRFAAWKEDIHLFIRLQLTPTQDGMQQRAAQLVSCLVAASRYRYAWDPFMLGELVVA
jgi:hypothetical protein